MIQITNKLLYNMIEKIYGGNMNTIFSGKSKANISSLGAYVDSLELNGKKIFFEKKELEYDGVLRLRGGSHICLPHFGLNDKIGYERHGFGRNVEWLVIQNSKSRILYEMKNYEKDFKHLSAKLEYIISENSFTTKLYLENIGDNEIEVSPGFHPYFEYNNIDSIKINGVENPYTEEELAYSVFADNVLNFESDLMTIEFETKNLNKFVVWTDQKSNYICVEPTYNYQGGYNTQPFILQPGKIEEFEYTIKVR